jgi:pimeloyl-ACP methyl ester carboxylesterase
MEKVAARGIIVVLPFVGLAGPEAFKKQGGEFAEDIAWMRAGGLARALADQAGPQAPAPDLRYVVASGHSSGGKAIVELYRKIPQQVAGVLLLEPVEIDPANMSPPCLGEGDHFDLGTPLLVMATGLGEQPGVNLSGVWPPCAPVGYSGLYFYDHFGGPKWYVKAEDYGHADILGNFYLSILQLSRFCKSAAHLKPDRFRTFVAGLIAAFIRGPVMGDARMLPYLEDEWSISLDVLLMHE